MATLSVSKNFEQSQWIWPESHFWDMHNSYALFRKGFDLKTVPRKAPLFITADQSYQLHINGKYVCRGPARGFQSHWPYDEVEVQSYLRKGRNIIAVRAHNPGFSNFQYLTQGYAGLLVAAKWGPISIVSDASWKCRRQSGVNPAAVPTSVQLFCQEHIDLREEDPDWMAMDFDDTSWTSQVAVARWNAMPWPTLEERGIPLLDEKEVFPEACLGTATGSNVADYTSTRDVASTLYHEGLSHEPKEGGEKLFFEPTGTGFFRRFLIDFGKTVVGSVALDISGAKGGEIVDTLHVETINKASLTPDFQWPTKDSHPAFSHRLICRKGQNKHVFYHPFGFRYMVLAVRDSVSTLTIRPFLRSSVYPLKIEGSFRCSDDGLNKIWKTCAWTQQCCSLDAYVDTPWREQAQWWGDARIQALNTFHLANDPRLFRRGIHSIAAQRTPDGLTYGHAPTMAHACILPDFSLIWLLTLWDHFWQTGSTEACEEHQEAVDAILSYFRKSLHPKLHLVQFDPRYWLFLDWTEIQREGCPSVLNLWLLITLERLADLWIATGQKHRASELKKWALELRQALQRLVDRSGLVHDGYDQKGKLVKETSVHSQTLAIMAGLNPRTERVMLDQVLRPFIREQKTFKAKPSAYWITYVFSVLQKSGNSKEVLAYIRKYWSPMVEHGTTWENFAPRGGSESFSHAWSAHPLYHLMQILGGANQTAPGWRKITYQPFFEGDYADVILPTPLGKIRSSWKRDGSKIKAELVLPKGISAIAKLPGEKVMSVQGKSSWLI